MDFIHDQLSCGRRFRCLNIVDDFTRVSWIAGTPQDVEM